MNPLAPPPPLVTPPRRRRSVDEVTIAYVHSTEVAHSWHSSMMGLLLYDLAGEGRFADGPITMRCATDGIAGARNAAVEHFLDETDTGWLFWIDTDMGFQPDTVEKLLAAADPVERPIVGGLCFAQRQRQSDGYGGFGTAPASTIMDWVALDGDYGFAGRTTYPINTLVRCAGTGSACILIHRSVFERIEAEHGRVWYDKAKIPNRTGRGGQQELGEDLSFCLRAGALNIPIHVHSGVRTTHLKQLWLAEPHYWDFAVAPPASAATAVIVPVMKRPANAAPFMASLRASTGMATAYAVADIEDTDTITAWSDAGAQVILREGPEPGTYSEKVNLGYSKTSEPWLFVVGDDVQFHPGWLDHAQAIAGDEFHVIGTNDLGNPRVIAGEHATHLLIRRSYVDEIGASWDGPGVVAHEGYRHCYVDDEMVSAAKQRGVWAMALGSKVEHLHPNWGKSEIDEVYVRGAAKAAEDMKLYVNRARGNGWTGAT